MGGSALKNIAADRICPICGEDNHCQHGEDSCWCEEVIIPQKLLDQVPLDKRGKVCICRPCIENFKE